MDVGLSLVGSVAVDGYGKGEVQDFILIRLLYIILV